MGPINPFRAALDWLAFLPIRLAFRLVWFMARTGHRNSREVYFAMWDANLNLPRLPGLQP